MAHTKYGGKQITTGQLKEQLLAEDSPFGALSDKTIWHA